MRARRRRFANPWALIQPLAHRKRFTDDVAFERDSEVNGWVKGPDGTPVLNTFAIDQPAFVIDPATGKELGYRALAGFTNSLLWNRDLSNAEWSGAVTLAQNAVGLDGVENAAWTITDASGDTEDLADSVSITDDAATYVFVTYIKKDTDQSRFPEIGVDLTGGSGVLRERAIINTETGVIEGQRFNDGTSSVSDKGNRWEVTNEITNNASGNTNARVIMTPAINSDGSTSADPSTTGSIVYDFGGFYLNSSIAGPPIETEGSPVSTAADNATEPFPLDLILEGTLVISARTANGVSGDQVLAQGDFNSEDDRIRIVRNGSREVRYIVTDGGTEVVNLNLGTVADDTDFRVAIRWADNDFAGIISGGTLQTDATGLIPALSVLRHGRDTADGDEWNGTIASVIVGSPYSDTDLEGAV